MIAGTLFPIYFMDSPQVLTASVTNIPGSGSSPLQVVANSGLKAAYGIAYIDTTGDYIGVYVGASGSEILKCIVGGGQNSFMPIVIHANSRVSLRSMSSSAITQGQLTLTFLGQGLGSGTS